MITIDTDNKLMVELEPKVIIVGEMHFSCSGNTLPVKVEVDFANIPVKYHASYANSLISQYAGRIIVHDNVWEEPIKKEKSGVDKIVDILFNPKSWDFKK